MVVVVVIVAVAVVVVIVDTKPSQLREVAETSICNWYDASGGTDVRTTMAIIATAIALVLLMMVNMEHDHDAAGLVTMPFVLKKHDISSSP